MNEFLHENPAGLGSKKQTPLAGARSDVLKYGVLMDW